MSAHVLLNLTRVVALWVGLQYVIMVFPDHTHLLFEEK